ncbi:hypothetical protein ANCCEY_09046 [Ancylostoma ceylanicum]|uniref:Integrase catalytic domain-containing protein n=2 Tax=Ancylostoma ceylanicum TaxID=53326 RepID=A0A0D6LIH9_9BILA|nr:hypothetical protein ANCCEY_09046 [Ancylostoma ceylanicum]EYB88448.1 hypothetical protein Y032_0246g10 [Ancylostoma ceylanicum]
MKRSAEEHGKCYGSIITCTVTRLIHLDVVSDQSTHAFLMMLRRFFARRGVPKSITSGNAPTFTLAESILSDLRQSAQRDASIARELSNREVAWKRITPYAPWQGGFYERLIKSVKHSLHKTLGKAILSLEELPTVIIVIEGLLNTRPLTYVSNELGNDSIVRPIDFLQKAAAHLMLISYPWTCDTEDSLDPDFVTPEQQAVLQTKRQAIDALQSSCAITEKFWKTWQDQYLTSLREKHTLQIGKKRGGILIAKTGQVVLMQDEVQPRHSWKMGIINTLVLNAHGTTREAIVRLPSGRLIRRPLKLLVPLELEGQKNEEAAERDSQENKIWKSSHNT